MYSLNNSLGHNLYKWKASESMNHALGHARINTTSLGFFSFFSFVISTEDSNRAADSTYTSIYLLGKDTEKEEVGIM